MDATRSAVRGLTVSHANKIRQQVRATEGQKSSEDSPPLPVPQLDPDYVQLYSRFVPSLQAAEYKVSITQKVSVPATSETLPLNSEQKITVSLPARFGLTTGSVHSVYPHLGQTETANVLPHIVLTDTQLPWERATGSSSASPWLAVLVFEVDELRLPTSALSGDQAIFHADSPVEQNPASWSIRLSLEDLFNTDSTATPIDKDDQTDPVDVSSIADFILLKNKLFISIFTSRDSHGKAKTGQTHPYAGGFQYLAHVKNINTLGMATAGIEADQGLYSVVISARTGPVDLTQPTRMVAHLVSIEGVEKMDFPLDESKYDYVALCSLYSWNYQCKPSSPADLIGCLETIGGGISPLRASEKHIRGLVNARDATSRRSGDRMSSGFTMTRYCVQTGDETVAFTRGPCIPVPNDTTEYQYLKRMADFPTDLQVLDQEVGIMDVSYSTAWQLGKSLALADRPFATALARIRAATYHGSIRETQLELAATNRLSKAHLLNALPSVIAAIEDLCDQDPPDEIPAEHLRRRWQAGTEKTNIRLPRLDMTGLRAHMERLEFHADMILADLATGGESGQPTSSDWLVVLNWVLDKMFLGSIPSQYLISDPSYLPPESLRFFHIDSIWMDALIDGALSLANHLEPDDFVRKSIKRFINTYLDTVDPDLGYKPQIPCYGFFLRSTILPAIPDLVVRAPLPDNDPRCPIIRQSLLDTDTLLCLFDRIPSSDEFLTLTFTRPPHQQGFFASDCITWNKFQVLYRKICTKSDSSSSPRTGDTWTKGDTSLDNVPYDWGSRCLLMDNYAQAVYTKLSAQSYFDDSSPTPEMMGIQLGGDVFDLTIQYQDTTRGSSTSNRAQRRTYWNPHANATRPLSFLEYPSRAKQKATKRQEIMPAYRPLVSPTARTEETLDSDESSDERASPGRPLTRVSLSEPDIISTTTGTFIKYHSPFFSARIYPVSLAFAAGFPMPSSVPGPSSFANDIVISLNVRGDAFASDKYLDAYIKSLVLKIPCGNNQEGCLFQWPQRTVGDMVSNRAFHLNFSRTQDLDGAHSMRVEVIPKFAPPMINDWAKKKIGLSWILSDVFTSEGSQKATVTIEENYMVHDPFDTGVSFMHAKNTIDVKIG
ncbi:hypothetical protein MY11210_002843 [Beauveria gryllotalpidicola]